MHVNVQLFARIVRHVDEIIGVEFMGNFHRCYFMRAMLLHDSYNVKFYNIQLRSKDLNDVKVDELGQAPAYPVPSLRFVFVSAGTSIT